MIQKLIFKCFSCFFIVSEQKYEEEKKCQKVCQSFLCEKNMGYSGLTRHFIDRIKVIGIITHFSLINF